MITNQQDEKMICDIHDQVNPHHTVNELSILQVDEDDCRILRRGWEKQFHIENERQEQTAAPSACNRNVLSFITAQKN